MATVGFESVIFGVKTGAGGTLKELVADNTKSINLLISRAKENDEKIMMYWKQQTGVKLDENNQQTGVKLDENKQETSETVPDNK